MPSLNEHLERDLARLRQEHLLRRLRPVDSAPGPRIESEGRSLLAFASNDYLGLSTHPRIRQAARRATERYGAGTGASRLITGSLPPHRQLEEELADFKGTEAALAFSSGYLAAIGAITGLVGREDTILSDRLNHASLIDGARLARARIRIFEHNDMEDLERRLKECRAGDPEGRILIVTESVFSMDGDQAPLEAIAALRDRYDAWLMVDEAHATGLFGANRRGLAEATGTSASIDIQMGTLGKAVGSSGGFLCGSRLLVDCLIHRARSFVYSTAPPPAQAAASVEALRILRSSEGERLTAQLWDRVRRLRSGLGLSAPDPSPIVPWILGSESRSLETSALLEREGILVPAIRHPTVPRDRARLRITPSASHAVEDVERLLKVLRGIRNP